MHLMVDIETLGITSRAPVIELAVVKFHDEDVLDGFSSHVYPDFSKSVPDVSTLAWWNKQEAKCPIHEGAPSFPSTIESLGGWLSNTPIDGVWANAPSFDLVILQNLADAHGISMPWAFRHFRDVRTVGVIGKRLGLTRPEPTTPHIALADAVAQAEWVVAINRATREKGVSFL